MAAATRGKLLGSRFLSSSAVRVKEMRTRSYLDKWLGSDIKAMNIKNGGAAETAPSPIGQSKLHPDIAYINVPIVKLKGTVHAKPQGSMQHSIVDAMRQLDGGRSDHAPGVLLDMSSAVIEAENDLKSLFQILQVTGTVAKVLGFVNCTDATVQYMRAAGNNPAPCLSADMSIVLPAASGSGQGPSAAVARTEPAAAAPIAAVSTATSDYPTATDSTADESRRKSSGREQPPRTAAAVNAPSTQTFFGAVRSGQQVYSPGISSSIILGNVNSGAEVLCDGDIHIYGKLMGRVLCGLTGNRFSSIYCKHFEASLVGIGESFVIVEEHADALRSVVGKALCISLQRHSDSDEHSKTSSSTGVASSGNGADRHRMMHSPSTRRSNNDSTSASSVLTPAVKIDVGEGYHMAFTVIPQLQ